ncbi:MAG: hypothetical protein R3B89_32975 [Polyangiaceae bacterium]
MRSETALSRGVAVWGLTLGLACSPAVDRPPPPLPPAISASAAPEPARPPPAVSLEVALLDGEPARLAVQVTVPREILPPGTKLLELPFMGEPFREGDGFASFVKPAGGGEYTGQYRLEPSDTATDPAFDVGYAVDLTHEAAGPRQGVDEVPFRTSVGWFLAGRAFIPTLKADGKLLDVRMRLTFPHDEVVDAFGALPGDGRVMNNRDLRDAFYILGPVRQKALGAAGTTFQLTTGDVSSFFGLEALVRDTAGFAADQLGELSARPRLMAFHTRGTRGGGVVGYDTSLIGPEVPRQPSSPLGRITVHELLHQWSRSDTVWLSEGFTRYFELKALAALEAREAAISETEVLDWLGDEYDVHAMESQGKPLAELSGNAAYAGGAMLAYCLDVDLTRAGASLESVYAAARQKSPEPGASESEFRAALARYAELPARLDELLAQPEAFPLGECYRRDQIEPRTSTYRGLELRDLALEVLKITGFNVNDTLVERVAEGSRFAPGDSVLEVAGEPIRGMRQVPWALRNTTSGQRFKVRVRRGDGELELTLAFPKLDPSVRPVRPRVRAGKSLRKSGHSPIVRWVQGELR